MKRLLLLAFFIGIILLSSKGIGQTITSTQAGAWNVPATWGGGPIPTNINSTLVQINHAVSVPNLYAATSIAITIGAPGSLTIDNGGSVSFSGILNQAGVFPPTSSRLIINGTLIVEQGGTITPGTNPSKILVNGTGVYRHNYTTSAGTVYNATWASGSTLEFTGYTTNGAPAGGLTQAFHHVTWNCPSQAGGFVSFDGTAFNTVNGNFSILNTNFNGLSFTTNANITITIGGNLVVNDFIALSLGSGNATIDLSGDLSLGIGDAIGNYGSGTCQVNFKGSSSQAISNQGIMSTGIDYEVFNGSTISTGGTDFISSSGTFILQSGATFHVGSADGLTTTTSSGNMRVSGTRTYNSNSTIIYDGTGSQNLGSEWGSSGALNTAQVNLTIDNSNGTGVTNDIIGTTSLVGELRLSNGSFNIGNSNTIDIGSSFFVTNGTIGGSSTANLTFSGSGTMNGLVMTSGSQQLNDLTISRSGDLAISSDLTIGGALSLIGNLDFSSASARTLTLNGTMSGAGGLKSNNNSNFVIGGTGAFGTINYAGSGNQLNNLTLARTSSGTYTWSSAVTINNTVNLDFGTLTHSSGLTMATNSTFFKGQGSITTNSPVAVSSYNVEYTASGNTGLEIPTSSTALNDLTLNSGGTVTLQGDATINGDIILTSGTLDASTNDVTMAGTGSNFTANGGNFTMNAANAINFTGSTTLGGTSIDGAQIGNTNISGTLNAPAANIFVSGLFNNTGTFNAGTGKVTFNGASSSISGSTTTFHDLSISNVLTAPSGNVNISGNFINLGTFNHNNGTVTFVNTASEILGSGGTAFNDIIFSGIGEVSITSTLDVNGNLTLASGSNLDANIGDNNIELAGNWINNGGSFNAQAAQVLFDGGTMFINGTGTTDFNDIVTSASTVVGVNGLANLEGTLTLGTTATFDANGGTAGTGSGTFTIISNATDDGRIAALPSGASVIDDLTFQRRIPQRGATNKWSNIGLAVRDATIADMQNEVPISGSFTNADPGPLPSLAYYDNTTDDGGPFTGTFDARWVPYPTTNDLATFTTTGSEGRGYSMWMNGTGDITFDLRGPVNQGTLNLNLTGSNEMWNLVGNPYPSSIDWDTGGGWTKTSIQGNTIYVWDGTQYLFWSGSLGTHGNGRIPMGMSFWVQGSAGSIALTVNEAAKTATTGTVHRVIPATYIEIALSDGTYTDKTYVELKDGANTAFEINDASKLPNAIFNLSSYSDDDHELAINAVSNDIICSTEIPLNISNISPGSYTINWANLESLDSNIEVILNDNFLGESYNLTSLVGDITIVVTSDDASFGKDRFSLIVKELDFSTDLITSGDQDCDLGLVGSITIEQSEDGVLYDIYDSSDQLITSGTGIDGNLLLGLPSESLQLGDNNFIIKASRGECAQQEFTNPVIVNIIDVPVVTYDALSNTLSTDATGSLQWYKDGTVVPGATSATHSLDHSTAHYHVVASNQSCDKSSEIFLVTGLEEDLSKAGIAIYPNPVNDIFQIRMSKSTLDNVLLRVLTVNGKVVEERSINTKITSIDALSYESGIYLVEIIDNGKRYIVRLVKQ